MTDIRSAQDVSLKDEDTEVFTQVKDDPDVSSESDLLVRGRTWAWDGDAITWRKILCDEDGRLIVSATTRPAGAAGASEDYLTTVIKNDTDFMSWPITNGSDWVVERFGGGTYADNAKIELYVGSGSAPPAGSWTRIKAIYLSTESNEVTINQTYSGDGTLELGLKLVNNTNNDDEMYGYFVAYEVTD